MFRKLYDWTMSLAASNRAGWWLAGISFAEVGKVIAEPELILAGRSGKYTVALDALLKEYKGTLDQI